MSNLYGPIDISSGAAKVQVSGYPDTACIVIYNESPSYLSVTFVGCGQHSYPAFVGDIFQARDGFNGTIQITSTPYLTTSGQAPANIIFILTYGSTDALSTAILKSGSTSFPISLNRLSNIGNSLNVGTSANSIVNDGNPVGTQLIESTPTGAAGSTWLADNTGNLTIKSDNAGVLTTLLQLVAGASPAVNIAASSILTHILGSLQVDSDATLFDVILQSSGASPKISSDASGNVNIDVPNGTRRLQLTSTTLTTPGTFTATGLITGSAGITSNGNLTLGSGKIQLIVGSLTRMTALSGTGSSTVNTNAGVVPNCIAFDPCTLSGSSQTIGGTLAASTVVTTGSGLAWSAMAYVQ